ncbi:MAG: hypothetical protein ACJ8AO_16690 [Gemmatimonadaceae bacterium]
MIAVAVAIGLVHLLRRPPLVLSVPGSFNDDGVYLVLGKAIAAGEGYRSIHVPGAPVELKYPPGLPLLLAALWATLGDLGLVVSAMRAVNVLAAAGAAALLWRVARRDLALPPAFALLGVLPLALEDTVQYWSLVLGEPWFVLGWGAALALAPLSAADGDVGGGAASSRRGALLGVVLGATALFRTQAAVLLPAFALPLLADRRSRRAGAWCLLVGAVPLAGWSIMQSTLRARGPVSALPDETPYLEWIPLARPAEWPAFVAERVATSAQYYGLAFGRMVSAGAAGPVVVAIFTALAVGGALVAARRRPALSLSAIAVALTALFWPWAQSRLALPLLPAAGLLAALALEQGTRRLPRLGRRAAEAVVVGACALMLVRQSTLRRESLENVRTGRRPRVYLAGDVLPLQSRLVAMDTAWANANTRPDEVLLVDVPAAVYLWTGRRAVSAAPAESQAARSVFAEPGRFLASRVLDDGVDVVVTSYPMQLITQDVRAALAACPGALAPAGAASATGFPAFFRVVEPSDCLRRLRGGAPSAR